MTDLPNEPRLLQAMDATWAPARMWQSGPWVLRQGDGGGKRVSAVTTEALVSDADITDAETAMQKMGQPELFMLRHGNETLDARLAQRGYRIVDPVLIYCTESKAVATIAPEPLDAIPCEEPLRLAEELWAKGGINRARVDVMRRTPGPKTYLFGRFNNSPAGTAFVAIDNEIAMLHALEVIPEFRGFGIARKVLGRAAIWALENNAKYLSVVTTGENLPAQGLFAGLGMQVVGRYHYRMK